MRAARLLRIGSAMLFDDSFYSRLSHARCRTPRAEDLRAMPGGRRQAL